METRNDEDPAKVSGQVWHDQDGEVRASPVTADWWFTHFVYRRLPEVLPEVDRDASALIMRLRRAQGILQKSIHAHHAGNPRATPAGQRILMTIGLGGKLTQVQVAQLTGMSTAAVSSAVRTLLAEGLLSRERDPIDKRAVRLQMTSEGHQVWTDTFKARNSFEQRILASLSSDDLSELNRILEKLAAFGADHKGGVPLSDAEPIE